METPIINNKYAVIEKIGAGSFGAIYKGQNVRTKEYVAIKVEPISNDLKLLLNESKIYQHLNGCDGIPNVKWFGKDDMNYYMVVNLLGPSLQDLAQQFSPFSLGLILKIGIKIILLLKTIHEKGLVHRDVKPDNFLFGLNKMNEIYLIDFGFCRSYLDSNNNNAHIKMKNTHSMIGSKTYASIMSHKRVELSRRDDLESLGYMLLYFYSGCLPWSREKSEDTIVGLKHDIIHSSQYPAVLLQYMKQVRTMEFEDTPNYYWFSNRFKEELEK
jgi:serine/threonine protein kinase